MFSSPYPHPQLQAIESIESAHPLAIDQPAFATQQHPDALIAKPWSGMGQIADAQAQGRLIFGRALSIPRRPAELG